MRKRPQRFDDISKITKTGKVKKCFTVPGVDYGASLVIIEENDKRILTSRSGHQTWVGIGIFAYAEPKFFIFEKDENGEIEDLGYGFKYNRKNKKEVFKKAMEYFLRMSDEN